MSRVWFDTRRDFFAVRKHQREPRLESVSGADRDHHRRHLNSVRLVETDGSFPPDAVVFCDIDDLHGALLCVPAYPLLSPGSRGRPDLLRAAELYPGDFLLDFANISVKPQVPDITHFIMQAGETLNRINISPPA